MSMNNIKNKSFIYVTPYGCRFDITLASTSTGYIFTIFIVMSGWFLLASAIV